MTTKRKQNSYLQQCNVYNILHPQKLTRLKEGKICEQKHKKKKINRNRPRSDKIMNLAKEGVIKRYYKHIQGLKKNINITRK